MTFNVTAERQYLRRAPRFVSFRTPPQPRTGVRRLLAALWRLLRRDRARLP